MGAGKAGWSYGSGSHTRATMNFPELKMVHICGKVYCFPDAEMQILSNTVEALDLDK